MNDRRGSHLHCSRLSLHSPTSSRTLQRYAFACFLPKKTADCPGDPHNTLGDQRSPRPQANEYVLCPFLIKDFPATMSSNSLPQGRRRPHSYFAQRDNATRNYLDRDDLNRHTLSFPTIGTATTRTAMLSQRRRSRRKTSADQRTKNSRPRASLPALRS